MMNKLMKGIFAVLGVLALMAICSDVSLAAGKERIRERDKDFDHDLKAFGIASNIEKARFFINGPVDLTGVPVVP